jgi:hypothetical protein
MSRPRPLASLAEELGAFEEAECGKCHHARLHHGHLADNGWVDESRCSFYIRNKRPPHGCRCRGFADA